MKKLCKPFRTGRLLAVFLTLSLILLSGCYAHTSEQPKQAEVKYSEKVRNLSELNDLNERAFGYHQHCLQRAEPMNERFMENFEYSLNLLADSLMEHYDWNNQYAVEQILERRHTTQSTLDQIYHTQGCESAEGHQARQHYRDLSKMDENQILNAL